MRTGLVMHTPADAAATSATDALQSASAGVGPLLQRDYWGVLDGCSWRPSAVVALVASRFCDFPPAEIVVFERDNSAGEERGLEVGDELDIQIRMAGAARVRVVHKDSCSFTLATLAGHPEAGRITFGAYRNEDGDVIFHIRSRARSSSRPNYLGFLVGGDPMQTTTWTDFVNNVAVTCGAGVVSEVHADVRQLNEADAEPGDEAMDCPTFVARGD